MKPGDFMLGLLDLFGVLLPGAIATALMLPYLPEGARLALHVESGEHASALPWVLYGITAYALGHFVFLFGSKIDDIYDHWRRRSHPFEADDGLQAAVKLRKELTPTFAGRGFSTFKWARCYVGIHSAAARKDIDGFEASSKFFRSLILVSAAAAAHFLFSEHEPGLTLAALVVGVLSAWRYTDQRLKMTQIAYASAVIIHATNSSKSSDQGSGSKDEDD